MSEMIDDRSKPTDLSAGPGGKASEFRYRSPIKQGRIKPNLSGAPLAVYLMTGTLTGLLGNRILLMSRSKTLIPCSPLTFLSLFIAMTMVASRFGL
jgi:hypothetical protein